ncbi:MAG: serine/threonine-protein phosphatase [Desulfuromonadales bacterium]|nr:serine/threonine-protein phosphatase [Desulfuromonadales bacterium]
MQHLLLISPNHNLRGQLCAELNRFGYTATCIEQLSKASEQPHPPALCLVDLQFQREVDFAQWQDWLRDCRTSHTACLGFDSGASADRSAIAPLEPLCDILDDALDQTRLQEKVTGLLTIRKLTRQLETTRRQLASYQSELQEALQSAAHIQRSLIPLCCPKYHNLNYAWRFMPSKQVGGDLFNVVQLDEQTVMTYLVDVSGHGISSAMVTVSVHQSLSLHTSQIIKQYLDQPPYYTINEPKMVLEELEAEYPFERFEEFFTISYMLINPHTGVLRYCNAGHPPPLLLRHDGSVERLEQGGTVIGMGSSVSFEQGATQLQPGDRLYLYTDGITEHIDDDGEAYGEERFLTQLKAQSQQDLGSAIQNALIAMRQFGGSALPVDDVTLVGIEYASKA